MRTRFPTILSRCHPVAGPVEQGALGDFCVTGRIGRLHLVTNAEIEPATIVPMLGVAASAGVDVVQVRFPRLPDTALIDLVTDVRRATTGCGTRVFVNDRVDVAVAAGADGVHLGQRSMSARESRRVVGSGMIVGVSVHSVEEAISAVEGGADYVTFGHVYSTSSHPGEPGRGLDGLRDVVTSVDPVPVMAIGGVTASRVNEVLSTGAHGVAVISAIFASGDIATASAELVAFIARQGREQP